MHVRKFEGETLEETLKQIKLELGPDAIILKTVTNKGLKGALKRKKIEITAAISEKDYMKKAQVDKALPSEMKEKFYENRSSVISNMIDHYSETSAQPKATSGSNYGSLGLNKSVKKVAQAKDQEMSMDLDQFLSSPVNAPRVSRELREEEAPVYTRNTQNQKSMTPEKNVQQERANASQQKKVQEAEAVSYQEYDYLKTKLEDMEQKLYDLNKIVDRYDERLSQGLFQLKSTLRSLEIHEPFIQRVVRKATFELSREQLEEEEAVFEFALKEMMSSIKTEKIKAFAEQKKSNITVIVSEFSSGRSSLARKIAAKNNNTILVQFGINGGQTKISDIAMNGADAFRFTDKVLGLNISKCETVAHVIAECRKSQEENYPIVIDYRVQENGQSEFKKFVESIKRSYDNVEIILSLSGIHSEIYNRKMLSSYQQLVDGTSVSHLDQCLCFGHVFNLADAYPELPMMLFGTGEIIPDDIEDATPERLLAGIFKLH